MEENNNEGRVYELAYLFVPLLAEETVTASFGDLKALLEKHGATFVGEEMPKMMELAYQMSRIIDNKKTWFDSAYFGWVKFEIDPKEIKEVEEVLARNEQLLRFMTIKTVRENTIASKKVHREYRKRSDEKGEAGEEAAPAAPINKEEVDKQIDALVTE
jgi:ribosomal protein S6